MINVANGLEMLEITATMMGKIVTIYPTLIWDTDGATLVDTGYPGQFHSPLNCLERTAFSLNIKTNRLTAFRHRPKNFLLP